jgi:hypothetical protein
MLNAALARLTTWYLSRPEPNDQHHSPADGATEPGFEIAQSMGIALLGLVVAAAFATALQTLGVDVVARIRSEIGL